MRCFSVHCMALLEMGLPCSAWIGIALLRTALHCVAVFSFALQCFALQRVALRLCAALIRR